jgi:SAM-dependent methyltransferase
MMPWNHNNQYHELVLAKLPALCERALEVGCGRGAFARRLKDFASEVDAIDLDPAAIEAASSSYAGIEGLRFSQGDFMRLELPEDSYDAIVVIATLHHMELESAFGKIRELLRPGGRLIILGLWRDSSLLDFAFSGLSVIANFFFTRIIHRRELPPKGDDFVTKTPRESRREIVASAARLLPGAKMRRLLLWRYLLTWERPKA